MAPVRVWRLGPPTPIHKKLARPTGTMTPAEMRLQPPTRDRAQWGCWPMPPEGPSPHHSCGLQRCGCLTCIFGPIGHRGRMAHFNSKSATRREKVAKSKLECRIQPPGRTIGSGPPQALQTCFSGRACGFGGAVVASLRASTILSHTHRSCGPHPTPPRPGAKP